MLACARACGVSAVAGGWVAILHNVVMKHRWRWRLDVKVLHNLHYVTIALEQSIEPRNVGDICQWEHSCAGRQLHGQKLLTNAEHG